MGAQIEAARKPSITDATKLDSAKFDAEIARLTKERDLARTELEVCKHDLDKLEADLNIISGENERLKKDQQNSGSSSAVTSNGLEKGSKEILEAKENEIQKLSERVKSLESEVQMLKDDKSAL